MMMGVASLALTRPRLERWHRPVAFGVIALALAWMALEIGLIASPGSWMRAAIGHDYQTYMLAASRWLAGGGFYEPYQLAGPYVVHSREIMYPPTILPLLVPFTVLPAVLWWAVPAGIIGWSVARSQPSPVGWATIAVCLALPWSVVIIANGNPGIWMTAAVAAGTRLGWPAVLVLVKPTMAPFALFGIRTRGWWLALGAMVVVSLALAPLWLDYLGALRNATWPGGNPLYSVNNVPLMLVPLIAWLGRRRSATYGLNTIATAPLY